MISHQPEVNFNAILIYDDGNGCCSQEPHDIRATHPEIAFRIALARGSEQRYGRRFVGLSHLEQSDTELDKIGCSHDGDADRFVTRKEDLAAFRDPRWGDVEWTEEEMSAALREPPLLVEIEGLDSIPWHALTHAYGPATDVPIDLRRLGSSDAKLRENAVWQLNASICHQGTLYPATSPAIPFLIRLANAPALPNRAAVCQLLQSIALSCDFNAGAIRQSFKQVQESFARMPGKKPDTHWEAVAERTIESLSTSRAMMLSQMPELLRLANDVDEEVATWGRNIIKALNAASPGHCD